MTPKPVPVVTELTRRYWEASSRGELVVQHCGECGEWFLYPRHWCPSCWAPEPPWETASGRGTVIACTTVHQAPYPAYEPDVPYVLAIVRLAEGAQLMANVVGCDPARVEVGTAVEVTFEDRQGIGVPQFRPVESTDESDVR
jgi:uncharacterized OB-fold protein